ncbi:hypothetical protein GCM10009541_56490 [Micromonospora gifhornensis]|uniref:Uncharacterized protein n=1 Tax=Micromonospora gifhornensis TaxID=84594 RepID=A0ABQ4IM20_9ACTN|nr:hypothetical protein Vgi01_56390 [Micromonospora gifhornensis]
MVVRLRHGEDPRQPTAEGIAKDGIRGFGGIALPPSVRVHVPADLDIVRPAEGLFRPWGIGRSRRLPTSRPFAVAIAQFP